MKMEPIVSSETSAIKSQTPGNYPKRNKLHLQHGESLRTTYVNIIAIEVCNHCVRMYYVDVNRLRTMWNFCGLVSVHETTVVWLLHCCIPIVIHLTDSWQTRQWDGLCQKQCLTCLSTSFMKIKKALVSVTGDVLCCIIEAVTPIQQLVLIIAYLHETWRKIRVVETYCDIDVIEI